MPSGKKLDIALYGRLAREAIEKMIADDGHTADVTAERVAEAVGLGRPALNRVLGASFGAYFRAQYPTIESPLQIARRALFLETGRRLARERGLAALTFRCFADEDSRICTSWIQRYYPEPKTAVMVAALQAGELRTVGEGIALRIPAALMLPMETQREAVAALVDGGPEARAA